MTTEAKTYRIKATLVESAKKLHINYIIDKKEAIEEAEIINALIFKGLENIQHSDIAKYLELRQAKKIK